MAYSEEDEHNSLILLRNFSNCKLVRFSDKFFTHASTAYYGTQHPVCAPRKHTAYYYYILIWQWASTQC